MVQNLSRQGAKLLHSIEHSGSVIFVIFFANAGAHLDLPTLARLWPVALVLAGGRGMGTYLAASLGGRLANDEPTIRKYGWTPLVSQAGIAIGVAWSPPSRCFRAWALVFAAWPSQSSASTRRSVPFCSRPRSRAPAKSSVRRPRIKPPINAFVANAES